MNKDAKELLDFDKPQPDPAVFGRIITYMYTGTEFEQRYAREIYKKFKSRPMAWDRIDKVLLSSESEQAKCCALQVLEDMVKTEWPEYSKQVRNKIQKFMVGIILEKVHDPISFKTEKVFINKLNGVLVEILKWEWPHNYPNIIPEMTSASLYDTRYCENNMNILRIFGEEIFERSSNQMTEERAKILKDAFRRDFHVMFKPCVSVLKNSTIEPLVKTTLNTVLHFLRWMPATCIFQNKLESVLINKHLNYAQFQMVTLKCLTEIVRFPNKENKKALVALFKGSVEKLHKWYRSTDEFAKSEFTKQEMNQNVSRFLCTFLKEHGSLIEKTVHDDSFPFALEILLTITKEKDVEALKVCLKYWNFLIVDLYKQGSGGIPCIETYVPVLTKLRSIMIKCMSKPEEVLILEAKGQVPLKSEITNPEVVVVEDEPEKIREFIINTDSVQIYKDMKDILVYLTHQDYAETERMMLENFRNLVNGTENFENLDSLCWAIGSISGTMQEEQEQLLLVEVLNNLLELYKLKQGNDDRAKISMNIMYIAGEYPQLLKTYWIFLRAVMKRLLAFMQMTQPGVKDMACCTFLKIAQNCRKQFLQFQVGEEKPFIQCILTEMKMIIPGLQPQQVHTFYEAVGYIIAAETDEIVRDGLIEEYMSLPNDVLDSMVKMDTKEELELDSAILQLEDILKINIQACMALGHLYAVQLSQIYDSLLNIYKLMSENIIEQIRKDGEIAMKQPKVVGMRNVNKEILKLVLEWINRSTDSQMVVDKFIPPLLDSVRLNYQLCPIPLAREPEVLSTMTNIVNRLKSDIAPAIPKVFKCVLECTFDMIKNSADFPEHQRNFLLLLRATVTHCFSALLNTDSAEFRLVWNSIIWAFEHTTGNVVDTGLEILHKFLKNMEAEVATSQSFYQKYYTDLLERLFVTVMQMSHSSDLTMQATLLAYMLGLVQSGKITVPLAGEQENMAYVQKYVTDLLLSYDMRLSQFEISSVVLGFFNLHPDTLAFKQYLRNFLQNCIREDEQIA